MARATNVSVQNSFVKGLVTEATGLTFPENACTDTDNCVFSHFGPVTRRLGFDFESSFSAKSIAVEGNAIVSYVWNSVAGDGDKTFVVNQVGNTLYFYNVSGTSSLSSGQHANTISLLTYAPIGTTTVANFECQFSSGNGVLFVTNQRLNTFYVSYNPVSDTITGNAITVQTRDFKGDAADPYAIAERPTSTLGALNAHHKYNLYNQGWDTATLTLWDTAQTTMPSNADAAYFFKLNAAGDTVQADDTHGTGGRGGGAGNLNFSTAVTNTLPGNSEVVGGHFIYSIYNTNRSSNIVGATDESIADERLTASAFYAGRVFYSGLKAEGYNDKIFFSQIIEDSSQYGKCYQTNDPTSEKLFALLPSDGGVIDLIECGTIFKLVPMLNVLLVFALNGIWTISGPQQSGFTANDFHVQKISGVHNISSTSFVQVDGIPFWWNLEGVHTVKIDPQAQTYNFQVQSISDQSIRTFFLNIPAESKSYARGAYDPFTKTVQWLYKSAPSTSINDKYVFDKVLNFKLLSQAFYGWTVDTTNVHINSIVNVFSLGGTFEQNSVTAGGVAVEAGAVSVVSFISSVGGSAGAISTSKYAVSYTSSGAKMTFAENYQPSNLDWFTFNSVGSPYNSYFATGYAVRGQAAKKFQQNYVNVFSKSDINTSFSIRGQWNYAKTGNSGKWSTQQTFNITSANFDYKPKRIKIRGHGLACQFKIFNNANEPFNIVGWSVAETGNRWV